jgi:AmmeMemoRadiSam system protein A
MSFVDVELELAPEHRQTLLEVALASILHGLDRGSALQFTLDSYARPLHQIRATFVTLRIDGKLRGCMGALRPVDPLVIDVAQNAFSSAFCDPRFEKLTPTELERVKVSISILSRPEPLAADSEDELLGRIRPGIDGLILYEGDRRVTLLPAVWEGVPDAHEFLVQLKRKAGLPSDFWSPGIRFERYTASCIHG